MPNTKVNNKYYIDGIKNSDPKVVRSIYSEYFQAIVHLVETHRGNKEDAQDVFQEGLMLMFKKVQNPDFQLTSSFFTYFYAVCRNIWSNKLRKKSFNEVTLSEPILSMVKDQPSKEVEQGEQYFLYRKMFLKLGQDCQKVLDLFLQKVSMEEIMKTMDYGSVSYTKKRKFLCKEKLVNLIKIDPAYTELKMSGG